MRLSEYEKNWSNKEMVEMVFVTERTRIEGNMHKNANVRVSDTLANADWSIILTEVKIFSLDQDRVIAETDFLVLNKSAITFGMEKSTSRCSFGSSFSG
jgi:Family of unknown function (DUF6812)